MTKAPGSAVAVVCYDAGGAEILSSFVRRNPGEYLFVIDGPARGIFERKLGPVRSIPMSDALAAADSLVTGSGWQSELQFEAIEQMRRLEKPSATFLDHWVYYPDRFIRNGVQQLPDELWVGDRYAWDIAKATFPEVPLRFVENPYFLDVAREWADLQAKRERATSAGDILYVCEPMRDHSLAQFGHERHWGYVEEEALRYFLSNVAVLDAPARKIVVRPHPSETRGKYEQLLAEFDLPVVFGGGRSLLEEMSECDVVVGCESMALVVALLAGRRAISCVPPGGIPCALPQREIEHFQTLVKDSRSSTTK